MPVTLTSVVDAFLGVKYTGTCPFCKSNRVVTTRERPCVNMSYAEVEKRCLACHATWTKRY